MPRSIRRKSVSPQESYRLPILNNISGPVPSWLVQSLAWAFILGMVAWVGKLDNRVHANEQATETVKQDASAAKDAAAVHFAYIKEALVRIETKIDSKEGK